MGTVEAPVIRVAEWAAERPAGWSDEDYFLESLAAFAIESYSAPGDRVLDPFAGSGTTLAAAQRLGRRAVGVELLADRVSTARARVTDPSWVIQGDALALDQMALGSFELCLTSPPYMVQVDHPQNPLTGYRTMDGDYSHYLHQMRDVFRSIAAHLTPTGVLALNVADIRTGTTVMLLADDLIAAATDAFSVREKITVTWDQPPTWLVHDYLVTLSPDPATTAGC